MDRAADLHSARNFVIGQIAEQAERQGEPLSDEQRLLLRHETPQSEVGRPPAHWNRFATDGGDSPSGTERGWGLVAFGRNRFGMRCYYALDVPGLETH
jgi:hypothetical protein